MVNFLKCGLWPSFRALSLKKFSSAGSSTSKLFMLLPTLNEVEADMGGSGLLHSLHFVLMRELL